MTELNAYSPSMYFYSTPNTILMRQKLNVSVFYSPVVGIFPMINDEGTRNRVFA